MIMVRRKKKTVVCCRERSLQQYAGVFYHLYDEIFEIDAVHDKSGVIVYAKENRDIPGNTHGVDCFFEHLAKHLVVEQDQEDFLRICNRRFLRDCLEHQDIASLEYREHVDENKVRWMQAEIVPVSDDVLLFLVREIKTSEYKLFKSMADQLIFKNNDFGLELEEEEKNLLLANAIREAKTDSLTLLYNQKAMHLLVNHRIECQRRFAIVFIDLDNFKQINDRYGHTAGDEVLKRVAQSFLSCVTPEDMAGRIGGDEFVLFLSGDQYESREEIEEASRNVCQKIRETIRRASALEELTCSMGISFYPEDGTDYGSLVDKADQALYRAKHRGKDRCVFSRECEQEKR